MVELIKELIPEEGRRGGGVRERTLKMQKERILDQTSKGSQCSSGTRLPSDMVGEPKLSLLPSS